MSALKSWHRATLIVVMGGLALAGLAWIVLTDPAVNYLPRHRDADWIVFPAAIDARAHSYASLDATSRREFVCRIKPRMMKTLSSKDLIVVTGKESCVRQSGPCHKRCALV